MQYQLTLEDDGRIMLPTADRVAVRAWIATVTQTLLAVPKVEQQEFEVKHTYMSGLYMRELFIPKGSLLVGKIHRLPCLNIVSMGDISVVTELGSARVKAGQTTSSPAGIQKLGYAHEDTVFINVFRTDETDPDKIEDIIAYRDAEAFARSSVCQ